MDISNGKETRRNSTRNAENVGSGVSDALQRREQTVRDLGDIRVLEEGLAFDGAEYSGLDKAK